MKRIRSIVLAEIRKRPFQYAVLAIVIGIVLGWRIAHALNDLDGFDICFRFGSPGQHEDREPGLDLADGPQTPSAAR